MLLACRRYWPAWADIYPNHLLVKKIEVPLLVMHGTVDEVRRWQRRDCITMADATEFALVMAERQAAAICISIDPPHTSHGSGVG